MNIKKIIKKYIINKIKKMIQPNTKAPTCGLTNIPTVDNSQPACDSYISTACVVASKTYNTLGTAINDNSDVIIEALLSRILDSANKIQILQNQVDLLNGSGNSDWLVPEELGNAWSTPTNLKIKEFPSHYYLTGSLQVLNVIGADYTIKFPPIELGVDIPLYPIFIRTSGALEVGALTINNDGEVSIVDKNFTTLTIGDIAFINLILTK